MKLHLIALTLLVGSLLTSCRDENEAEEARIEIRLKDDPCDCQQVNIDLKEIQIKLASDTAAWLTLNTNSGIYDLLLFQNLDTIVATGSFPLDTLKEIRFILGPDNTVMVDSVIHELKTPSAEHSGLKVKIDQALVFNLNSFLLDFDAALSVKELGNGEYMLDPVIKLQ